MKNYKGRRASTTSVIIYAALLLATAVGISYAQDDLTGQAVSEESPAPSEIEAYVSSVLPGGIRQFGYDLFLHPPSTFAPVEKVPVGPDYVLGPGDEIRVSVWGKVEGQWAVEVDRDGNVSIPKIGVLGVAGLAFEEAKELLHREFSRYYKDFDMNVSMGPLRTIRVYVVGNVARPGAYTVSSLSTLINALFVSGGPGKNGTMRGIELKRSGETASRLDLYDFLLRGDKSGDMRLMPEDVIFIPPIGPIAAISGSVKNPAIYELDGEAKISDLIGLAGGLSATAFRGRVQIERIIDNTRQVAFESNLEEINKEDAGLSDGDIVRVFGVVRDEKVVRISGAVHREGDYAVEGGMDVRDLVETAGGLRYYAYTKEAELTRVSVTQSGPVTEKITIDLEKAMAGDLGENMPLRENDYLFVRSVPEWRLYRKVSLHGEVRFPGTYTIAKGERLSSAIERAGGFTDKAFLRGATFTRQSVLKLQQEHIDEMAERLERELRAMGATETGAALMPEEAKIIEAETRQKMAFIDAVRQAKAKGRMVISLLEPEDLKRTAFDIELEDGDVLYVPPSPQSVQVIGSVYTQTAFVYDPSMKYSDYIALAGGYTENADKKRVYILKVDGSTIRPDGGISAISWSRGSNRWEYSGTEPIEPGDTIVVPEKLEKVAWLREIKDITQILYQIAVSAGVLIVVF